MTIDEALAVYLQQLRANGRSEHTQRQYSRHIRWLAEWGREHDVEHIQNVTSSVLAQFLCADVSCRGRDGKEKSQSTINVLRSSLRTFFGFLCSAGYMRSDPARLISLAHCEPPPPRALTDAEVDRLLAVVEQGRGYAGKRDRALVRLLLAVGLRIGAALNLKREDLCEDTLAVAIRRGKRGRQDRFHVPADVLTGLVLLLNEHGGDYVFANRAGTPLTTRHVQRRFELLATQAELRPGASLHTLRHTFATRLLTETNDIALVQAALGHRSITSTLVYARTNRRRVRTTIDASWQEMKGSHYS